MHAARRGMTIEMTVSEPASIGRGGSGPLGILAGGGNLPEQIAEGALAHGRLVHVVALQGEAGPGVARFPHTWVNWGSIGRMIAAFRAADCQDLVIVGSVTRPDPGKVRPDLGLIRAIPTIVRLFGGGDDHVLRNVVRFFELQGFTVRGVADVAPELVMAKGALGEVQPTASQMRDIATGFFLIDALAHADVGQAAVVFAGRVLAIEAAEGTDRMLQRLRNHGGARGGVLVKRPKPGQEMRVDVPVIGPRTVELCANLSLAGIAVEAGKVLVAERARVTEAAAGCGLFVTGIEAALTSPLRQPPGLMSVAACGRLVPDRRLRADIVRALGVMRVFDKPARSGGVAVVRRHVIAIETGEGLPAMLGRVQELRQWGATARSKRRGVVALAAHIVAADSVDGLVEAVADSGIGGVVLPSGLPVDTVLTAVQAAERLGLVIVEAGA